MHCPFAITRRGGGRSRPADPVPASSASPGGGPAALRSGTRTVRRASAAQDRPPGPTDRRHRQRRAGRVSASSVTIHSPDAVSIPAGGPTPSRPTPRVARAGHDAGTEVTGDRRGRVGRAVVDHDDLGDAGSAAERLEQRCDACGLVARRDHDGDGGARRAGTCVRHRWGPPAAHGRSEPGRQPQRRLGGAAVGGGTVSCGPSVVADHVRHDPPAHRHEGEATTGMARPADEVETTADAAVPRPQEGGSRAVGGGAVDRPAR